MIAAVWLVSACGEVRIAQDPLVANLPASEVQACRQAVLNELKRRDVSPDSVHRVPVVGGEVGDAIERHRGGGVLVIELSERCQVQDVWERGPH